MTSLFYIKVSYFLPKVKYMNMKKYSSLLILILTFFIYQLKHFIKIKVFKFFFFLEKKQMFEIKTFLYFNCIFKNLIYMSKLFLYHSEHNSNVFLMCCLMQFFNCHFNKVLQSPCNISDYCISTLYIVLVNVQRLYC